MHLLGITFILYHHTCSERKALLEPSFQGGVTLTKNLYPKNLNKRTTLKKDSVFRETISFFQEKSRKVTSNRRVVRAHDWKSQQTTDKESEQLCNDTQSIHIGKITAAKQKHTNVVNVISGKIYL